MSKLAAITERLNGLKQKLFAPLSGLSEKLPFLKKFLPVKAPETKAEALKKKSDDGLRLVYREGNTSTRLSVFFVFVLFAAFVYFGGNFMRTLWGSYKNSKHANQLEGEYTHQFAKEMEKVSSRASIVSLGRVSANAVHPDGREAFLNADIWVTCDNPETAKLMENIGIRTHDVIIDVFRSLSDRKISPVTDEGKEKARQEIIAAVNKTLPHGKITAVNFYNLVIESN